MTLRLKLQLIVSAMTLLFAALLLAITFENLRESVREEVTAANRVAWQLLERAALHESTRHAAGMLEYLTGLGRLRSNEITLTGADGARLYASPPSAWKAGRDAPGWFARQVAPPDAERAIDLSDGRVSIRSNPSRAVLDAWEDTQALLSGMAVLLVVANLLVSWIVRRAVDPLGQIVSALGRVEAERFDVRLPPLSGAEAAAIGHAFNRMMSELGLRIETERRAMRAEARLLESREMAGWADRKIEEERRSIARELHDELGQSVTAMRSMALSIARRVRPHDAASADAADVIASEASRLYGSMQGMIPRLTPLMLDSLGLADALDDLADRTRLAWPELRLSVSVMLGDVALKQAAALALYRAAQEGITNAIRHGDAGRLELTVACDAGAVRLCVTDDGGGSLPQGDRDGLLPLGDGPGPYRGDDRRRGHGRGGHDGQADGHAPVAAERIVDSDSGHHGLRWMSDRVEQLGGTVRLQPSPAGGMRLEVSLPLRSNTVAAP